MKRTIFRRIAVAACCALAIFTSRPAANGVILLSTGDTAANTAEPAGALANSGWQYQGNWGAFLGTPIAPHFFIAAAHVGRAASVFSYNGETYTLVRSFPIPDTDLLVWQVVETFPTIAPLWTRRDEIGQSVVVIGRGTQRGADVTLNSELHGWRWGSEDHVRRWGQNVVTAIFSYKSDHNDLLVADFDNPGAANEAHLSGGDSSGAVFINDGGTWKLAGINYGVDGPFFTDAQGGGQFLAALFDARGFYYQSGSGYTLITGTAPVPASFYSTRIASQLAAIYSITDPLGDIDADGVSNLLEYALHLDPISPDPGGLPFAERGAGTASLVYRKSTAATDLAYAVEQSADLVNWTVAQTQDTQVSMANGVEVIRATVSAPDDHLFLRLRVTRP